MLSTGSRNGLMQGTFTRSWSHSPWYRSSGYVNHWKEAAFVSHSIGSLCEHRLDRLHSAPLLCISVRVRDVRGSLLVSDTQLSELGFISQFPCIFRHRGPLILIRTLKSSINEIVRCISRSRTRKPFHPSPSGRGPIAFLK